MEENPILNKHNKAEYPPAHTAEHLLNQTMDRMFGCGRAISAHIEEKKSKCDYQLESEPTPSQISQIEETINKIIGKGLDVTFEFITQEEAKKTYNLKRLPEDASQTLRIVHIGDYDACPCIGTHVGNTSEIGSFKILSSTFTDNVWRVRWKTISK